MYLLLLIQIFLICFFNLDISWACDGISISYPDGYPILPLWGYEEVYIAIFMLIAAIAGRSKLPKKYFLSGIFIIIAAFSAGINRILAEATTSAWGCDIDGMARVDALWSCYANGMYPVASWELLSYNQEILCVSIWSGERKLANHIFSLQEKYR